MELYMEYFGYVTGLLYIVWEIRQNNLMWIVGILSAIAYVIVFAGSGLYAAMSFQLYYLAVSIYGLASWKRDKENEDSMIIYRVVDCKILLLSLLVGCAAFCFIWGVLNNFTDDPMPVTDAVIASLSIVATWWLSKSYIHQWLLWVLVNCWSVFMFISQHLYLTAVLYILYAVFAVYGFLHWRKKGKKLENKQ